MGTVRPEFLGQLLGDSQLASLPTTIYPLRPLTREALRLVIEGPARLAGIGVEDELVARLVEDTASGEALPLLAFTLAQLAKDVSRSGQLSIERYHQDGGVQGALARQADAALNDAVDAGGRGRKEVIAGLLRLVTVDEQGRPTRWRVNREELPDLVVVELDAFVTRRLLTTDTDKDTVVISVAHEAFLSAWPPLAKEIARNVSALRARRAVEHAAAEWTKQNANGHPPSRLWEGGQLAAAVADITDRATLSPAARDFMHASIRRDRYRHRRATTVLSVLLILALAAAGIAAIQRRAAQDQQRIATARQLVAQADAIRDTDPRTALQFGIAAQRIDSDGETQSSLVNTLTATRYAGTLTSHGNPVSAVAFAPDRQHILATGNGDGTVILWDLSNLAKPRQLGRPLTGHTSSVNSLAFAPDGDIVATGSSDGTVILWDLTHLNDLRNHATERACSLAGGGLDSAEWARYIRGLGYRTTCPG